MEIREVQIQSPDAQLLIGLLDQELSQEYAPTDMHVVDFAPFHRDGGVFVIAYDSGDPVGCGALRPLTETEVELKRMYVAVSHRGMGVARSVLRHLEDKARQLGFSNMLLETGDEQHAAVGLYVSSGYQPIEAFGEYEGGLRSVCFAKKL